MGEVNYISSTYSYSTGLGVVEIDIDKDLYEGFHEKLECYTKGTETFGNCQYFQQIMGEQKLQEALPAISIFPNPVENTATLKFDQALTSGPVSVSILNALGQVVLQQQFTEIPNQQVLLSLEKLIKGIYLVQVKHNNKTYSSRLVKQ